MPQGDSLRACYFDYPGLEDMMVWLSGLSGAHTYSIFAALSQAEARADRLARLFLLTDFGGKAPSLSWFNSGTTIWIWKKRRLISYSMWMGLYRHTCTRCRCLFRSLYLWTTCLLLSLLLFLRAAERTLDRAAGDMACFEEDLSKTPDALYAAK